MGIPEYIDITVQELRTELVKTGNYAFTNVTNLIESHMDYDQSGKHIIIGESTEQSNIAIIQYLYKATQTQTLLSRVAKTAAASNIILEKTIEYYQNNFGGLDSETTRIAEGITKTAELLILSLVDTDNLNEYIIRPAAESLYKIAHENYTKAAALSLMQNKIAERFYHYIAPLAQTQLEQLSRELSTMFANNFELVWVQYVREREIGERREFCAGYDFEFTKQTYHIEEVKNWPIEHGHSWDGMLPGTTRNNILTNAGGYNCLHSFKYLQANQVPNADKQRAKEKGYL